jgi:Nitrous oxide-stimulated promoter
MECIDRCPYREGTKPVCGLCPAQCFDAARLQQFKQVMSYAGPRMLMVHPILTMLHFFDTLRTVRKM